MDGNYWLIGVEGKRFISQILRGRISVFGNRRRSADFQVCCAADFQSAR
jgi:hypothetical protein